MSVARAILLRAMERQPELGADFDRLSDAFKRSGVPFRKFGGYAFSYAWLKATYALD